MRLNFSGQKTSQNLDACSAISNIDKIGLKNTKRPTPIAKDEEIRYWVVCTISAQKKVSKFENFTNPNPNFWYHIMKMNVSVT